MQQYKIYYQMFLYLPGKQIIVEANDKQEAYYKAVHEVIPKLEGSQPYSAHLVNEGE